MKSLLHKILLSSLIIILLPMGAGILWTSNEFSHLLERRFAEKSRAQAERIRLLLDEKQETATGLVSWIAEIPGVKVNLKEKDRNGLFQLLLPLVGSVEFDFIEILDAAGNIFLRVHDPSRYGDRPDLAKDIQGLLQGMRDLPHYGVEERDGRAYLRAAESIEDGVNILGAVGVGYALDRELLGKMEQIADARVAISIGERVYSIDKTVLSPNRMSLPIENSPDQELLWHRDGPSPSLEIRLPLETARGIEGLISLYFPTHEMTAATDTLQKTLILVGLMGIALALSISWILSRRLTRPLKKLVARADQVAAGNYEGAVSTHSKDEIGALAISFNHMLEELRRSKAEVEGYRQELEEKFAARSKELTETEKKRATMAHMIAHDLKNPLLGIKKTLERLEGDLNEVDAEQKRRVIADLLSAGDLVIGMVNEMLDLYRSDYGDIPLSVGSFQIEDVIQTSLRILGPDLEEKEIRIQNRYDPPRISVSGDKKRLTRLLINLLSNAIKFSPHQGRVYIHATVTGNDGNGGSRVLLRVEDEGMGIPEEDLPKIFDRSYARGQGKVETGTGLGLPYCKLVAEAHRGKIWAENRRQGGFAVSVALPVNGEEVERTYAA